MSRLSHVIGMLKQQKCRKSAESRFQPMRDQRRRMFLESLETRVVLAVAVEAFMPTASGFVADFTTPIQTSTLNLYDAQNNAFGPADVTLQGSSVGAVQGSLVVNGDKLTFIKTGGPLAADNYTVTLRSAANGIVDQALGELLDGEFSGSFPSGNGTAGGDFVFNFTVAAPQPLVVSLPDFARGPTQALQSPAPGSGQSLTAGLPIHFSQTAGLTSFTMTIAYDPSLLEITGVELGAGAPAGSQVQANTTVAGQVTLAFFALDPLSSGGADLLKLIGSVPEEAAYGSAQVLSITALEVNAGSIQATADSGLHVVAFPGDANANRRYDAEDARLIARTGLGLDMGFVTNQPTSSSPLTNENLYPFIDPIIIGDVTGIDGLSPLDASDILRAVVGLPTPNIPALPTAQAPTNLTLSTTSVGEGLAIGTQVGTFTTADPDVIDTHTYTLVAGDGSADNNSFTIFGNSLRTAEVFNQATKDTYQIRVRTTDSSGRSIERTFTISVTHENAAPTSVSLSQTAVAENSSIGTAVGTLTTSDPNATDTFTYTLVSGAGDTHNGSFTIVADQLLVNSALDFETQDTYSIRVRSTDQGGLSIEQVFVISVTDVNEQPTSVALSNVNVAEGLPVGTAVGTLTTSDPDIGDSHTYALVAGDGDADNASFFILGDQLTTTEVFTQATQSTYSIRVRSTDAGGFNVEQTFTINVTEANSAPTAVTLSNSTVDENSPVGTAVGTLTTAAPNPSDTHTYLLVPGEGDTDNAAFAIIGDTLQTAAGIDFESQETYSVRVRSTDQFGLSVEQAMTITVNDLNEAPTSLSLSNNLIEENAAIDTVIGELTAVDPDASNTHTFALVNGEGDADNAHFAIIGNELRSLSSLDFETQSSYSIRVQALDQGGLAFEHILTITVTDVNEQPTAVTINQSSVAEGEPIGMTVGTLSTTDPDQSDTHTYSLVAGDGDEDNASFSIVGTQLQTAEVFNLATKSSYTVRVSSVDQGGLSVEQILTITITEANVAPTSLALSNAAVDENVAIGSTIGTFSTTDDNNSDTHTYSLVTGDGDEDNAAFTIVGDALQTAAEVDFELQDSYSIRVRTTDPYGLFVEQSFTITVNDLNEAPTALSLSNTSIEEDAPLGTVIGVLTSTDPDASNTHTYSLVPGDGDTDNGSFEILGDELQLAATLDFETQTSYNVRIQSQDQGGLSFEQIVTISVTNVNEQPTAVSLSNDTIEEGEPVGTVIGVLTTSDPDDGDVHTYTLVSGDGDDDNASFTIDGSELKAAEVFDFSTQSSYSIRVQSQDQGGLAVEQVLTITITTTEVNVAPTAIELSNTTVDENATVATIIGTLTSSDANAGDTHTYGLVEGDGDSDNGSFTIVGNTLMVVDAVDFETQSSYSVRIRSTDAGGLFFEQAFTITVNDLNESPTSVALSNNTVAEDAVIGTIIGLLSASDPDAGDDHTFSLVSGDGDSGNAAFLIVGNELQLAALLDFETQDSYEIRVRATDLGGEFVEIQFTILVTDVID